MAKEGFNRDKTWSDHYLPAFQRIACDVMEVEATQVEVADDYSDQKLNTDLLVTRLGRRLRVACRVRGTNAFRSWPDEFTIRAMRPNRAETEIHKILRGWGDYAIYAFAGSEIGEFLAWTMISYDGVRERIRELVTANLIDQRLITNPNGDAKFLPMKLRELPEGSILAKHRPER